MKIGKIILLLLGIIIIFTGCKTETKSSDGLSDTIVVYFSATGNTKAIAKEISQYLHCGLFEIKPMYPYKPEDLKYSNSRSYDEHVKHSCPEIGRAVPELSIYKNLIIGYPIWYGEAPGPIRSYASQGGPFKGVRIIPFCTSESSPIGNSCKDAFKDQKVKVEDGIRFDKNASKEEIHKWVDSLNLK